MSHFKVLSQHVAGGLETKLSQVLIVQHLVKSRQCYHVSQLAECFLHAVNCENTSYIH
jgi:hypothetical protein